MLNVKKLYNRLESDRAFILDKSRRYSELSIPYLVTRSEQGKNESFYKPFNSLLSRGVNNLASKLLLTLLPPNQPFFRLSIDELSFNDFTSDFPEEEKEGFKLQLDLSLSNYEREIQKLIVGSADRNSVFELLQHLIVTGNGLVFLDKDRTKVYSLDKYVCRRDGRGEVIEIITKEMASLETLPTDIQEKILKNRKEKPSEEIPSDMVPNEHNIEVFTRIYRENKNMKWYQEIEGEKIEGSNGSAPIDKSPWLCLRFFSVSADDYGRGLVEHYIGDIESLESLSQALLENAAACAKTVFLVEPNSATNPKTLSDTPNLGFCSGRESDITVLRVEKNNDFAIPFQQIEKIERRLSMAFLMNSSIQREAERVTAEEIRLMSQELEASLGSVYSLLSTDFQIPFLKRKLHIIQKNNRLPSLDENFVSPIIVTGLDALGRSTEANVLTQFLSVLGQTLGQEFLPFIKPEAVIKKFAASLGVDTTIVKTENEIKSDKQEAQQVALEQSVTPRLADNLTKPEQSIEGQI